MLWRFLAGLTQLSIAALCIPLNPLNDFNRGPLLTKLVQPSPQPPQTQSITEFNYYTTEYNSTAAQEFQQQARQQAQLEMWMGIGCVLFVTVVLLGFAFIAYRILIVEPETRAPALDVMAVRLGSSHNFTWAPPTWKIPTNLSWAEGIPWTGNAQHTNGTTDITNLDLSVSKGPFTTCINANVWGLGFDDGPSNYTTTLLHALKEKGVKATFFVIGSMIANYPDVLIETYNAGHQIGIHTWSHQNMSSLTEGQMVAEIVTTARAIKELIGVTPRYWRPPCNKFPPSELWQTY
ncbi:chitin deacetylase [Podochytrium sp. JEL0797]|nr:chitin deacetylase [Podochytrium sp. JEL0797]